MIQTITDIVSKVVLIGGSGIGDAPFRGAELGKFDTNIREGKGDGIVYFQQSDKGYAFIPRHGASLDDKKRKRYGAAHAQYLANLVTAKKLGAKVILATSAVGVYRKGRLHEQSRAVRKKIGDKLADLLGVSRGINVGSICFPYDHIDSSGRDDNAYGVGVIMHSHPRPAFDDTGRRIAYHCALEEIERFNGVHWNGVYLTMRGDRVGTEAEGTLRANYADFAGMCVSTEASMAMQLGLQYIPIVFVVDSDSDFNHEGGTVATMNWLSEPDRVPAYIEELLPRLLKYAERVRPLEQLTGNIIFHNIEHVENRYLREIAEEMREAYGG